MDPKALVWVTGQLAQLRNWCPLGNSSPCAPSTISLDDLGARSLGLGVPKIMACTVSSKVTLQGLTFYYLVATLLVVLCFGLCRVYVPAWSSVRPYQVTTIQMRPWTQKKSDFGPERGRDVGLHTGPMNSGASAVIPKFRATLESSRGFLQTFHLYSKYTARRADGRRLGPWGRAPV